VKVHFHFKVTCNWDDEARVWYVAESNVPGLSAEAPTVEAMNQLLSVRIPELVELNMRDFDPDNACFELVTRQHLRFAAVA
jgi:hypothetical protein